MSWRRQASRGVWDASGQLMAVAVETEPVLRLSKPRPLFEGQFLREDEDLVGTAHYDIAPDGDHFVMVREESLHSRIHVVLNWAEELKQKVPPGRR